MTTSSTLALSSEWERILHHVAAAYGTRTGRKKLIQTLHNIKSYSVDASSKLLNTKHLANIMSANEKTRTEIMVQLDDFFFQNVVAALSGTIG
ncbi:hypothetical protein PsorP6_019122 [Peronosclerospora sorghi]|nr:hypothetical protein PsorP6_019122 [Peronosclerospora sorghi]